MRTFTALVAVIAALLVVAPIQAAAPPSCFAITNHSGLNTKRVLDGLPLTPDLVREIRSRLSSYGNASQYPGLTDLGLPPDVLAEINRRIKLQVDEWNKYPLGYPCKPFKNATRSAKFILSQLKYNGFYAVRLTKTSPRQFQFSAVKDGYDHHGVAAKTAPRQITISVTNIPLGTGTSGRFTTPFEA